MSLTHRSDVAFTPEKTLNALWKLPGGKTLLRVRAHAHPPAGKDRNSASPPPGPDPSRSANHPVPGGMAEALEMVEGTAKRKIIKEIKLDAKAFEGANLWPQTSSGDGRYLLAGVYRKLNYVAEAPRGVWIPEVEKYILVDLDEGKLKEFSFGALHIPRYGVLAIMPAARQVLLVDNDAPYKYANGEFVNPNHGMWAIPFSGKPANRAPELGLPETWAGTSFFPGKYPDRGQHIDRVAVHTRPAHYGKAPGARHLIVFFNSAEPLRVFTSNGLDDQPINMVWERMGNRLAFSSGREILVWQPTEEASEPAKPATGKEEDF